MAADEVGGVYKAEEVVGEGVDEEIGKEVVIAISEAVGVGEAVSAVAAVVVARRLHRLMYKRLHSGLLGKSLSKRPANLM